MSRGTATDPHPCQHDAETVAKRVNQGSVDVGVPGSGSRQLAANVPFGPGNAGMNPGEWLTEWQRFVMVGLETLPEGVRKFRPNCPGCTPDEATALGAGHGWK